MANLITLDEDTLRTVVQRALDQVMLDIQAGVPLARRHALAENIIEAVCEASAIGTEPQPVTADAGLLRKQASELREKLSMRAQSIDNGSLGEMRALSTDIADVSRWTSELADLVGQVARWL